MFRPWGACPLFHSSMDNPQSAHCQTKRPTSGPSYPPKSGLPGWTNKSPAVTLPVPSLPRVPCIKAGFRRQTHRAHSVPLIHAHKNIPLNLGRAHTRFPFQITLLPYPQASTSSLDLARRIPLPSHLDGPCLFQPICLAQNLTHPAAHFPINSTRWTTNSRAVFAPLLFDQEPWARSGLQSCPERSLRHFNPSITH